MRKLVFFLLLLVAMPVGRVGAADPGAHSNLMQRRKDGKDGAVPGLPFLTFKTDIGALINPIKQAYFFGADLRLTSRISADAGAGAFIGSALQYADHEGESYKGLRVQAGLKYYLIQSENHGFYLGLEGKYHDIKHVAIREIFRQGQQYLEFYPVERKIRTQGVAGRAGWQFYLGQNKRLLLEPYAGFGVQFNQVERLLPPDAEMIEEPGFLFEFEPGNSVTPTVHLGVHLGVVLW